MLQTIGATIDPEGNVKLLGKISEGRYRKGVLIFEEPIEEIDKEWSLVGSVEILTDDLEEASREISEEINRAIERSAQELANAKDHVEPN
ncbi:MAG: hypothetical protein IT174_02220 [Acidobacteria bacterium]|nr:hypothetical protein [Acidobacteriota bacterium]